MNNYFKNDADGQPSSGQAWFSQVSKHKCRCKSKFLNFHENIDTQIASVRPLQTMWQAVFFALMMLGACAVSVCTYGKELSCTFSRGAVSQSPRMGFACWLPHGSYDACSHAWHANVTLVLAVPAVYGLFDIFFCFVCLSSVAGWASLCTKRCICLDIHVAMYFQPTRHIFYVLPTHSTHFLC